MLWILIERWNLKLWLCLKKKETQKLFKFGREHLTVPRSCVCEMAVRGNDRGVFSSNCNIYNYVIIIIWQIRTATSGYYNPCDMCYSNSLSRHTGKTAVTPWGAAGRLTAGLRPCTRAGHRHKEPRPRNLGSFLRPGASLAVILGFWAGFWYLLAKVRIVPVGTHTCKHCSLSVSRALSSCQGFHQVTFCQLLWHLKENSGSVLVIRCIFNERAW